MANFDDYRGQRFVILPDKGSVGEKVVVETQIVPSSGTPVRIDYFLRPEQGRERCCPYHKLNTAVLVMETAEGRSRYDPTEQLDWSMDRSVLAQRQMSASLIIVGHIRSQDSPQVVFPEDDHVVEALPPDRADEPLNVSILPGRPWCRGSIPDAKIRP